MEKKKEKKVVSAKKVISESEELDEFALQFKERAMDEIKRMFDEFMEKLRHNFLNINRKKRK